MRVRARSGQRTTEGWRARIHLEVGCSQTAVFASERVPKADARHRELSKERVGVPINVTCNAGGDTAVILRVI